ncbi:hypothetical protein R80B4_01683 [Fibrobacteres bacterium R8-0-B4]
MKKNEEKNSSSNFFVDLAERLRERGHDAIAVYEEDGGDYLFQRLEERKQQEKSVSLLLKTQKGKDVVFMNDKPIAERLVDRETLTSKMEVGGLLSKIQTYFLSISTDFSELLALLGRLAPIDPIFKESIDRHTAIDKLDELVRNINDKISKVDIINNHVRYYLFTYRPCDDYTISCTNAGIKGVTRALRHTNENIDTYSYAWFKLLQNKIPYTDTLKLSVQHAYESFSELVKKVTSNLGHLSKICNGKAGEPPVLSFIKISTDSNVNELEYYEWDWKKDSL